MRTIYPILAVLITCNAFWAKRIHNTLGVSFARLLNVTDPNTSAVKEMFMNFDIIRWNALAGCAIALVLIVLIARDKAHSRWIKWMLGLFWVLTCLFCLLPN
jgi:hypothetical protein